MQILLVLHHIIIGRRSEADTGELSLQVHCRSLRVLWQQTQTTGWQATIVRSAGCTAAICQGPFR